MGIFQGSGVKHSDVDDGG